MEWLTESIEKVICFVQERPFLFDVSSAELAWTCTKIWCKKLEQVSCASFLRKFLDCVSPPSDLYTMLVHRVFILQCWYSFKFLDCVSPPSDLYNACIQGIRPPVLVFVQSKDRAKDLFHELVYDAVNVDVIHADRTQPQVINIVTVVISRCKRKVKLRYITVCSKA